MQTQSPADFLNNVKALVTIAQVYGLPAAITTSASGRPERPGHAVVAQGLPNAAVVHRLARSTPSTTPRLAAAVKATGRRKLLIAGISTDVCVAFAALSAKEAGYDVYAVVDASGTWSKLVVNAAIHPHGPGRHRADQLGCRRRRTPRPCHPPPARRTPSDGRPSSALRGNNYAGFLAAKGQRVTA